MMRRLCRNLLSVAEVLSAAPDSNIAERSDQLKVSDVVGDKQCARAFDSSSDQHISNEALLFVRMETRSFAARL